MNRRILAAAAASAVVATGLASAVHAASYASGISETVPGTVNFTLNETVAAGGEVIVVRDGVSTSLGALAQGTHSFTRDGATNFSIVVKSNTFAEGYRDAFDVVAGGQNDVGSTATQISQDSNTFVQFERPVGLAVNNNPASPYFGRIYVTNPREIATGTGRAMVSGIYMLNADQTDAGSAKTPIDWTGSTANPYHISLDGDGNIYVADWSDTKGTVYRVDPTATTGTNLFVGVGSTTTINQSTTLNHGSIAAVAVTGKSSDGTLKVFTIDEDTTTGAPGSTAGTQGVYRYDVGAVTSGYNTPGTRLSGVGVNNPLLEVPGVLVDMKIGPDGKIYLIQNRGHDVAGNSTDADRSLSILSADGTLLYDSKQDSIAKNIDSNVTMAGVQDVFRYTRGVAVSPDGEWLATATNRQEDPGHTGVAWVVPMLDGIPDLANRLLLDAFVGATNDTVEFDAAGNLYVGNRTSELLRVFSPGMLSVTQYNSNGTFTTRTDPEWDSTTGGNYSDTAKWMLGFKPDDLADSFTGNMTAKFGTQIAAPATVNMDQNTQLGYLKFEGANKYTISGTGTITLDSLGEPRVIVKSGSHEVSAPVVAKKHTIFHVQDAAAKLNVTNLTANPGVKISKGGAGTLEMPNARLENLAINKGTVEITPNGGAAGTSIFTGFSMAAGAALDLNDNDAIFKAGSGVSETQVRDWVKAGRVTGSTSGIFSTPGSPDDDKVIAVASNTAWGKPNLNGLPLGADDVVGKYTYFGDANLDGKVTGDDYLNVDANLGTGDSWLEGDFNMSGVTTGDDYLAIDANLGKGTADPLAFAELKEEMVALHAAMFGEEYLVKLAQVEADGFGSTVVPEPAAVSLIALGALGLLGRRRRKA